MLSSPKKENLISLLSHMPEDWSTEVPCPNWQVINIDNPLCMAETFTAASLKLAYELQNTAGKNNFIKTIEEL